MYNYIIYIYIYVYTHIHISAVNQVPLYSYMGIPKLRFFLVESIFWNDIGSRSCPFARKTYFSLLISGHSLLAQKHST